MPATPCPNDSDEFQHYVRRAFKDLHKGQADIKGRITQLEKNINEAIQFESLRVTDLENRVKELEQVRDRITTIDKQLADHSERLNKLERFSQRNNIRVIILPHSKDEDCLSLAKNLLQEKFNLSDVKIKRAHRDGPKIPGNPQHLLFKLNCYRDKLEILHCQRQALQGETFFCIH